MRAFGSAVRLAQVHMHGRPRRRVVGQQACPWLRDVRVQASAPAAAEFHLALERNGVPRGYAGGGGFGEARADDRKSRARPDRLSDSARVHHCVLPDCRRQLLVPPANTVPKHSSTAGVGISSRTGIAWCALMLNLRSNSTVLVMAFCLDRYLTPWRLWLVAGTSHTQGGLQVKRGASLAQSGGPSTTSRWARLWILQ